MRDVDSIAEILSGTLRRTPAGEPLGVLVPAMLRLLARGVPASAEEIALATGETSETVRTRLRSHPDVELDEDGAVVGMGLTLRPTQHRFETGGRRLYTWCALDTLMYPPILGRSARVESPCRATGEPVRLVIDPDRVRSVDPPDAAVSIVIPDDACNIRTNFCNEVHFFRSGSAATQWLAMHPGAMVVPVADAFEIGRALNARTLKDCC